MLSSTTKKLTESLLLNNIYTLEYPIDFNNLKLDLVNNIYKYYLTNSLVELFEEGYLTSSDNIFNINDIILPTCKLLVLDVESLIKKEYMNNCVLTKLLSDYPLSIKNQFERDVFLSKLYSINTMNVYKHFNNYHYNFNKFINSDPTYIKLNFKNLVAIHNLLFNRIPVEYQKYRSMYSQKIYNDLLNEYANSWTSYKKTSRYNLITHTLQNYKYKI